MKNLKIEVFAAFLWVSRPDILMIYLRDDFKKNYVFLLRGRCAKE